MGIKGVFFDLDGTLVTTSGAPVSGVPEMIADLEALGLKWVVGSNRSTAHVTSRLRLAQLSPDGVLSQAIVGAKKPSPEFCYKAATRLGVRKNELVYVGDDNLTDAICAINAGVLYLNASWSNKTPTYGVMVNSPQDVVRFIRTFMMRDAEWYWKLEDHDSLGPIDVRSIIPGGRDWDPVMGPATFSVLKLDSDVDSPVVGKFSRFLFLYLLTTIYLDELHDDFDSWCIIPPSGGQGHRKLLYDFLNRSSKLFKEKFLGDLLIRHRPAAKAAFARSSGEDPGFLNQATTLRLNVDRRKSVVGKRVVVIDDFCTRGHSFECARHLLLRGGATKVTCVSVGRYGTRYTAQVSRPGLQWDPWVPSTFVPGDFTPMVYQRSSNPDALPPIKEAFSYIINS